MEKITYLLVATQIDFSPIASFFQQSPDKMLLQFFFTVGWIPIAAVFVWGVIQLWVFYCQSQYSATLTYNLLAIDIPRSNELSPKAVESIFTYIAGAHSTFNLIEKYWDGLFQLSFSFEIVSIEGYTQFLLRAPTQFRDMAETAVYSQYPDAEITEVNDYTETVPTKYPDDEYDCWGCEFIPAKHWSLPIKTWKRFEHPTGRPEEQFKDPMAVLMDLYSSLGKGEQLWQQIIVYPTGYDWTDEGEKQISKIIGEKTPKKKNIVDSIVDMMFGLLSMFSELIYSFGNESSSETKEDDNRFLMMSLKPKQKKQIEAIQEKIGQLGFGCKIRFVYVAKKEVMNNPKARNGFIGYMKLFMDLDTNNLKPDMDMTATSQDYFFEKSIKNSKKTSIMGSYKSRSGTKGRKRFIMTGEELATLWHFPIEAVVKAPLIQKAPGRKSVPPSSLPTLSKEEMDTVLFDEPYSDEENIFSDIEHEEPDKQEGENHAATKQAPVPQAEEETDIFDLSKKDKQTETEEPSREKQTDRAVPPKGSPPPNLPFA